MFADKIYLLEIIDVVTWKVISLVSLVYCSSISSNIMKMDL